MIQVTDLTKRFGRNRGVEALNFEVHPGKPTGFLGRNGAGKTTTMRLIMGYLGGDSGDVRLCGQSISASRQAAQQLAGYLPENAPLYKNMLISEYLEFTARSYGLRGKRIKRAVDAVIRRTDLVAYASRPIAHVSRGYRQRVGLAAALIHDPQVLVLDEPTSGLDPHQARTFGALLRELSKTRSVLISSHVLSEVEELCESVIIIDEGRLVRQDTMNNLRTQGTQCGSLTVVAEPEILLLALRKRLNLSDSQVEVERREGTHLTVRIHSTELDDIPAILADNGWPLISFSRGTPKLDDFFRTAVGP